MNLFRRNNSKESGANKNSALAEMVLRIIHDGVIITDKSGVVEFINPAAANMTSCGPAKDAVGLDYGLILKLESKEGRELSEKEIEKYTYNGVNSYGMIRAIYRLNIFGSKEAREKMMNRRGMGPGMGGGPMGRGMGRGMGHGMGGRRPF